MEQNTPNNTSITKLNINGKPFYIKVLWNHNAKEFFHIKLYDDEITWSGIFSNELVNKYKELEETEEQYYNCVQKCLKGCDDGEYTYDFKIKPDDSNSATFTWKKKFHDSVHGTATLIYGSVPVQRGTIVESKDVLLDLLLAENSELRNEIDSLKDKNVSVTANLEKCKTQLEIFADIKACLEASLYGKFVQLLNAKKRRIQVLEDGVHALDNSKDLSDQH